jgi:hypothetical protein
MADFLTDVSVRVAELEAEIKQIHQAHAHQLCLLRGEIKLLERKLITLSETNIIAINPVVGRFKRLKTDLNQEVERQERQRHWSEQPNQ